MNGFWKWWWEHCSRVFTGLGFNRVIFLGVQEYRPTRWDSRIIVFLRTSAPAACRYLWSSRLMMGLFITFRQTDPATLNEGVIFESDQDPSILEGWFESHWWLSLARSRPFYIPFHDYARQLSSHDILERVLLSSLWKHSHMTVRSSMFKVLADLINCRSWCVVFSDWSAEICKLISSFISYLASFVFS